MGSTQDSVAELLWQLSGVGTVDWRPFEPVREFRFAPPRRFRFDVAFPEQRVAVEVDGGGFVGGRHGTGVGMENDSEKYSIAAGLGWRIVRVTPRQVRDGKALTWLLAALSYRAAA